MSQPRYPEPTPEQVEAIMNDPNVVWTEVPADELPPELSEDNAAELLRRAQRPDRAEGPDPLPDDTETP